MRKVIHLIPYDGIGGVETAARSMAPVSSSDLEFRVETIFSPSAAWQRWRGYNPLPLVGTVLRLWQAKPAVLVVSLWRAYIVGLALKLLRPDLRLVVFLHLPNDVHCLDRLFTRLAAHFAYKVWADSQETLTRRVPDLPPGKGRVISFVTAHFAALPPRPMCPNFVFWGRVHAQKGLDRAVRIFAALHERQASARFFVIGPDGGDLSRVRHQANKLGLGEAVHFLGGMDFATIRQVASNASFFLQTSLTEGMAMSVMEAMQLGLVPVVTAVGEIAHYAKHGINALVVLDDAATVADVSALLGDHMRFQAMRQHAIATWADQPLYRDSVLAACREVLGLERKDA